MESFRCLKEQERSAKLCWDCQFAPRYTLFIDTLLNLWGQTNRRRLSAAKTINFSAKTPRNRRSSRIRSAFSGDLTSSGSLYRAWGDIETIFTEANHAAVLDTSPQFMVLNIFREMPAGQSGLAIKPAPEASKDTTILVAEQPRLNCLSFMNSWSSSCIQARNMIGGLLFLCFPVDVNLAFQLKREHPLQVRHEYANRVEEKECWYFFHEISAQFRTESHFQLLTHNPIRSISAA